jgi:hypothetical protein
VIYLVGVEQENVDSFRIQKGLYVNVIASSQGEKWDQESIKLYLKEKNLLDKMFVASPTEEGTVPETEKNADGSELEKQDPNPNNGNPDKYSDGANIQESQAEHAENTPSDDYSALQESQETILSVFAVDEKLYLFFINLIDENILSPEDAITFVDEVISSNFSEKDAIVEFSKDNYPES